MEMNIIVLIIVLQILVVTLTGCSQFETKLEEMNRLNCQPPDVALCAGWQI
jgi:uncharacterized lipoprotein YehR (DUF1307 family)